MKKSRIKYFILILLSWTIIIAFFSSFELFRINKETNELAKAKAIANINKDQALRFWGTLHGGVYIPIDSTTQPNPALSHIPERDIETPSGKKLTLMNPAYMLRQLNEYFAEYYGIVGHITSKKLLREKNQADEWELKALNKFEEGITEVSEYSTFNDKPFFRLMKPLYIKKSCLKCHAHQDYKVGDIRGGISVSIPMQTILSNANKLKKRDIVTLLLIWLLGAIGLIVAYRKINSSLEKQHFVEHKLKKQNDELITTSSALKENNNKLIAAQENTEKSNQRYKVLSNASFEAIFISEKGYCIEQNNTAATLFGYSHQEAIRLFATDIFAEESREIVKTNVLGGYKLPYDVIALRKDGTKFHAEVQGYDFYLEGKKLRITAIRDITARKEMELDLLKAKEKAEESDLLKTEFIRNISHEIRTPLNGILGFSSLLSKFGLSDEKKEQHINIIKNSGNQLTKIIDDILEISKIETKQLEVIEKQICLNDLFSKLHSTYAGKAKGKKLSLRVKTGLPDKESIILIDAMKLMKTLSNLLKNAIIFTDEGFVEFGYHLVETHGSASLLQIYVKDTGIGIKQKNKENIFNRFAQEEKEISRKIGGLGLGLSIAKGNVELLGGKITLETEKGKGSTFFVTIPYKKAN